MQRIRALAIWAGLALALGVPLCFAATSEYLAWRDPVYIAGGFAGVVALCLLALQPLLATGALPGVGLARGRRVHRAVGVALVAAVVVHVAGLWVTSPPDIVDALLLRAPTPFAVWGVVAMWATFAAAAVAAARRRLRPRTFRALHTGLAGLVVVGGAVHALLIEGTMEATSKAVLCALAVAATAAAWMAPGWIAARRRR